MDPKFKQLGFTMRPIAVNAFTSLGAQFFSQNRADIGLRLDFPGAPASQFLSSAKGVKRKWDDIKKSSLILGLGRSSSSSDSKESSDGCILTSATEDESSMDPSLSFNLHQGNDNNMISPQGSLLKTHKVIDVDSSFHLQLSLSTRPTESGITTAAHNQITNEAGLVDDGSTSSPWKSGRRVLSTLAERSYDLDLNQSLDETDLKKAVPALATATPALKGATACTSGLTQPQRSNSTKTCQFTGCRKGARGASGLCIAHGGGRRCQREGCHKGAEGRTVYCKAHGGGRRCEYLGCTKSAEGRTDYCIAHGGGRRCGFPGGCTKAARGKSGLCIRHGGGKRCEKESCTKSAEGYSGLCIAHGGGRRCQYPDCNKGAQGSTNFCKAHGGGKRCTFPGCTKGAEGSTPLCKGHGGGRRCSFQGGGVCTKSVHGGTKFCVAHGGGKRCAMPECTKSARGRTNFCVRHGGGKRCKFEGCGKSAQGSTDFCKAHGGGKRCAWGQQPGQDGSCDKFARGKTGFCQAHAAMLQDKRVHGGGAASCVEQKVSITTPETVPENPQGMHIDFAKPIAAQALLYPVISLPIPADAISLPEGRVHGGGLMAMLARGALNQSPAASNSRQPYAFPRWV